MFSHLLFLSNGQNTCRLYKHNLQQTKKKYKNTTVWADGANEMIRVQNSLFTQQIDGYLPEKKTKCAEGKTEWLPQSIHKTAIFNVYILQDIG